MSRTSWPNDWVFGKDVEVAIGLRESALFGKDAGGAIWLDELLLVSKSVRANCLLDELLFALGNTHGRSTIFQ